MIAMAALMWGTIGFFVKGLSAAGFSAIDIVAIRVGTAAVLLLLIGFLFYREYLKIKIKHLPLFLGTGLLSIVFFNWCYFTAIEKMNIPVAAALLYTSPAFVITLSALFLKEGVNLRKIMAVFGTVVGAAMVAGIHLNQDLSFPATSIFIGLGAGLGYALYSIFGKVALQSYHPFTLTLYTFLVAAIFLVPSFFASYKPTVQVSGDVIIYAVSLGLFPTVMAYFAYSWGLEKVESSQAAIVATIEPVTATFLGIFMFAERITLMQSLGIVFILSSVLLVNISKRDFTGKKEKNNWSALSK
ncbi:EamA family transporter [Bacillus sp. B15-48]|nr:EamA family transporter [Bacillus sp. B15-48]